MYKDDGSEEANIDHAFLEDMAHAGNERVASTGDAVPAIIGHTTDDPNDPQKPVKAYFTNFKVLPFFDTGRYALAADLKYHPQDAAYLNQYPRRSVEAWIRRRQVDPVALLGGTTPDRDLGLLRLSRGETPVASTLSLEVPLGLPTTPQKKPASANGTGYHRTPPVTQRSAAPPAPRAVPLRKAREDEVEETETDKETPDTDTETETTKIKGDTAGTATDPTMDKYADLFASAPFQEIMQTMQEFKQLLAEMKQDDVTDPDAGDMPPDEGDVFDDHDPGASGGPQDMPPVEGESMEAQEGPPVRFEEGGMGDGSGLGQPSDSFYSTPGGSNTCIPNTIGKREMSRMSRPTSSTPPRGTAPAGRTTQPSSQATSTPPRQNDEVIRLQREVATLKRENTEAKADKAAHDTVVRLQRDERVHFKDEAKTKQVIRSVYMAGGDEAVSTFVNDVILPSYPRMESDPTAGFGNDPLARLARRPDQSTTGGADLNDPETIRRLSADASRRNISWEQAIAEHHQKNGTAK